MKLFILITGIGEILVGLLMILKPTAIPQFTKSSGLAKATARMYGAAAISIGVFALLVFNDFEQTAYHQLFLRVFFVFHVLVALSIILGIRAGEPADSKIAILHTVLAAMTAYFLWLQY